MIRIYGSVAIVIMLGSCVPGTSELEARVVYLEEREQIREVYLRYGRGFDRNDVELLRTAFWPEAQINYYAESNTVDQFIEQHLSGHTAKYAAWGHLITNESMDIDGDTAHVEAYVTALWSRKKDEVDASNALTIMSGRYIDRLDRRNGEWRIAVREFIGHFAATTEAANYFQKKADCSFGTWDRRDPSYRRPLTARTATATGATCAE